MACESLGPADKSAPLRVSCCPLYQPARLPWCLFTDTMKYASQWFSLAPHLPTAFSVVTPSFLILFIYFILIHCSILSACLLVALFPKEDNGAAVVLFAVAGSRLQGTAMSKALHVPEPFSITRYPLLQNRLAVCPYCYWSTHRGASASRELHYRYQTCCSGVFHLRRYTNCISLLLYSCLWMKL